MFALTSHVYIKRTKITAPHHLTKTAPDFKTIPCQRAKISAPYRHTGGVPALSLSHSLNLFPSQSPAFQAVIPPSCSSRSAVSFHHTKENVPPDVSFSLAQIALSPCPLSFRPGVLLFPRVANRVLAQETHPQSSPSPRPDTPTEVDCLPIDSIEEPPEYMIYTSNSKPCVLTREPTALLAPLPIINSSHNHTNCQLTISSIVCFSRSPCCILSFFLIMPNKVSISHE